MDYKHEKFFKQNQIVQTDINNLGKPVFILFLYLLWEISLHGSGTFCLEILLITKTACDRGLR